MRWSPKTGTWHTHIHMYCHCNSKKCCALFYNVINKSLTSNTYQIIIDPILRANNKSVMVYLRKQHGREKNKLDWPLLRGKTFHQCSTVLCELCCSIWKIEYGHRAHNSIKNGKKTTEREKDVWDRLVCIGISSENYV